MHTCEHCGGRIQPGGAYNHLGQTLCEDCYMDALNPPKACDPWAVYIAKKSAKRGTMLTSMQERIIDLLSKEGPMTSGDLQRRLKIGDMDLRREFATLRHMERVRAIKKDQQIWFTLFNEASE